MYKSKQEMQEETSYAKQVSILTAAERLGFTPKKRGNSYELSEQKGVMLFPQTNSYYDFYAQEGGSTIDFVMNMDNQLFHEAVAFLINGAQVPHTERNNVTEQKRSEKKAEFVMPTPHTDYRRAFAYLHKTRGLDGGLISRLMQEDRIYEETKRHNIIFTGTDKNGVIRHGFIKGSASGNQFRGDVYGSDKNYGFNISAGSDTLLVFEAPIDLLSYMTLEPSTSHHLLAIGGLIKEPIYAYLESHPSIEKISFLFDRDEKGIDAKRRFSREFAGGYDITYTRVGYALWKTGKKDVNDLLLLVREQRQIKQAEKGQAHGRTH